MGKGSIIAAGTPDPNDKTGALLPLVNGDPRRARVLALAGYEAEQLRELAAEEVTALADTLLKDGAVLGSETILKPARWGIAHPFQKFVDDQKNMFARLEGIVVFHHQTRGMWKEGEKVPLCSALLASQGSGASRQDSGLPWAGKAAVCSQCPFDAWGTDPKGGKGKACKQMQRLFIKIVDPVTQDLLPVTLNVPPTSLDAFYDFTSGLRRRGQSLINRTTATTLEAAQGQGQTYSEIRFAPGRPLTPRETLDAGALAKQFEQVAKLIGLEEGDYMGEPAAPGAVENPADDAANNDDVNF